MRPSELPPGQQWIASDKWPTMGERVPRRDDAPWRVELCGAVAKPRTFSLAELRGLPQVERAMDIHCVTRWSKPGARFAGVRLSTLLDIAQPVAVARFVSFVARSQRGHSTSLRLADAVRLGTLVALECDGAPLADDRGGPARVVVPDRYFYKSLKWLERIELLEADRLGYWEATAGYHNTADPRLEQRYIAPGISKDQARSILATRDITGRDLRSLDARGQDLAGLVAPNALLRDADFRECRLRGACFDGANLTNAHFELADLRDASFDRADLEGANFTGAELGAARLLAASFLGASFCDPRQDATRGARFDTGTQIRAFALDDLTPEQAAYVHRAIAKSGATLC